MKKVAMSIHEECTNVCIVVEKKEAYSIKSNKTFPSCLDMIRQGNVAGLTDIFSQIKDTFALKDEEVYITIPSSLLKGMKSYELPFEQYLEDAYRAEEKVMKDMDIKETDLYYFSYPLKFRSGNKLKYTACVISSAVPNDITNVGDRIGLNIVNIEPEEIALSRHIDEWDRSYVILSINKSHGSVYTYNPDDGICLLNEADELGYLKILNAVEGNNIFSRLILANDNLNMNRYQIDSAECMQWPIYINSTKHDKLLHFIQSALVEDIAQRIIPLEAEDCFHMDRMERSINASFLPLVNGLMVKPIYEELNRSYETEAAGIGDESVSDIEFNTDTRFSESTISKGKPAYQKIMYRLSSFFRRGSNL